MFLGALFGTLSHVVLDSLMHADMAPLLPWSKGNPLYGAIAIDTLHWLCLIAGVLGAVVYVATAWAKHRKASPSAKAD